MFIQFVGDYAGMEIKQTKTGTNYMIVRFISETGKILETISKDFKIQDKLKRKETYLVKAELNIDKYTRVDIIDLTPYKEN